MKIRNLLLLAVTALLLTACNAGKNVPYMINIDEIPTSQLAEASIQAGDFTIKPGDMLQINVTASKEELVRPFNKIKYVPTLGSGNSVSMGDRGALFYQVDDDGNIEFPILGKLHIVGMTKKAVENHVASLIYPQYLNERPEVECRIQNFRVYCLGEFGHAGVVYAENGQLTVVEAIVRCGDLGLQGRRDNIMLIRTDPTGQRTVKRININDANFLASPDFFLQQNDILYVEPTKYKKRSIWSVPPAYSFGVGVMGTLMSIFTFITVRAKL